MAPGRLYKAMLDRRPSGFSAEVRAEIEQALAAVSGGGTLGPGSLLRRTARAVSFKPAAEAPPIDVAIQAFGRRSCRIRTARCFHSAISLPDGRAS